MLVVFFGIAPLFLVTLRSWANALLILGSFFSLIFLLANWDTDQDDSNTHIGFVLLVSFTLIAPVYSIVISSSFRGQHAWADYDSASRFLVAVAIFLFAWRRQVNITQFFQYTAPSSLVLTLLYQLYFTQPLLWESERMSTYFADPLVFGYTSLTLGLISLVSINLLGKDSKPVVAFKLLGTSIGFYLSIMSGSRTGWLAAPIVIALWLYQQRGVNARRSHLLTLGIATALAFGLFSLSSIVHHRVELAFQEIADYSWTGTAPETPVGMRITFLRIAWDLFMTHPITGFGDTRDAALILPAHIYTYATPESIRVAVTSGFHNELVTNAVRYGIVGLLATIMLFASPLYVFSHQLHSQCSVQRANALIGVVLTLCILVSSLSTEVFDLKYTASFYALMIALLCASSLAKHTPQRPHRLPADDPNASTV